MLKHFKVIWTKFANFIAEKDIDNTDHGSETKHSDDKVLLIGRNKSNLEDVSSIITQLDRDCIWVETIEEATKYLNTNFPRKPILVILDFDKSI